MVRITYNSEINQFGVFANCWTDPIVALERGSKEFERFLAILGNKIRLKGWDKYRGGLDVKGNRQLSPPINLQSLSLSLTFVLRQNLTGKMYKRKQNNKRKAVCVCVCAHTLCCV